MMVIISYDVDFTETQGAKRLRKVAKICEQYGVRVQNSVFETIVDSVQLTALKSELINVIDMERDTVRFYNLGNKWNSKIDTIGKDKGFRQDDVLII